MKNILARNSLIVDSGFWFALANPKDRHHPLARSALDKFQSLLFVTTWPVITESCYLIGQRVGHEAQLKFLHNIQAGGSDLFHIQDWHWSRLVQLMHRYRNLPMDLADASLVILAENLGHGRILSTDQRDFQSYRWKNHEPFDNLLLPD